MSLICGICKKEFILHGISKKRIVTCAKCGKEQEVDETKFIMSELICGCGSNVYLEGKASFSFYPDNKRYNNIIQNKAREALNKGLTKPKE